MSKGKILIIDDDPDVALATRLCLEAADYEVTEARNSVDGLAQVKSEQPDLIILDVMMATATEGFQTALTLRSPDPASEYVEFSAIPIIMLTSIHQTTPMRFGPDDDYLPVDEFIDKPIDPKTFIESVDRLLANRG